MAQTAVRLVCGGRGEACPPITPQRAALSGAAALGQRGTPGGASWMAGACLRSLSREEGPLDSVTPKCQLLKSCCSVSTHHGVFSVSL